MGNEKTPETALALQATSGVENNDVFNFQQMELYIDLGNLNEVIR